MFENCKNLELIEFNGNFTTSQYIDMSYMLLVIKNYPMYLQ